MMSGTAFAITLFLSVDLGTTYPVLLQSLILKRVTEGHTARLQCTMRNGKVADNDVHWYWEQVGRRRELILKDYTWENAIRQPRFTERFQSSREPSSNSFILTITNMQPNDTGVYYCSVWGRIYGRGSLLIVDSITGPVVLQSPSLERVTEGHTAELQCTMRNATVTHTDVHWCRLSPEQIMEQVLTHPGNGSTQWSPGFTERFQPFRDSSINSLILIITNVQPSDTGVYYCSVWGKIFGRGSLLIVDSITGPVLLQSPSLERVTEGHTARLQCTMRNSAVTHTNVHWYRLSPKQIMERVLTHPGNGSIQWTPGFMQRFQPFRDSSSNSFTLTITNVQPSDTGVYYCSVLENIYGTGSQLNITDVNVPVLHQSPSLERVTEAHTARLQCTMRNASVTHTNVHWDREKPGNKMEWVLTHDMRNITQWSPGFTERFQSSREPSNNSFILTITNTQPNDTGVYYCKAWGDISGNGTQLNVTEESSHGIPWTSDSILIIGTILGFTVLICIVLLTFFLWKQKLCSSVKDSSQGSPVEDQNIVYTTVNDRTRSSERAAVPPVVHAEGECHYAEVHFHRQGSSQPTVTAAERSSEYAVIKRARN